MSLVREEEDAWREKMAKELGAKRYEVYSDEWHRDYLTVFYTQEGVVIYYDSTGKEEEYPSPPSWLVGWLLCESKEVIE